MNPWLGIPAADYEAHMSAAGQTAALREFFGRVYAKLWPTRVAIFGCTTGGDLESVDPAVTDSVVGVDINPTYLSIARDRFQPTFGARLTLIVGDVLQVEVPPHGFDLVHAALLLEYVEPEPLFARMARWLAPGGTCSVVTQEQTKTVAAVSDTGYASLRSLADHMVVRARAAVVAAAERSDLRVVERHSIGVSTGKVLAHTVFRKFDARGAGR